MKKQENSITKITTPSIGTHYNWIGYTVRDFDWTLTLIRDLVANYNSTAAWSIIGTIKSRLTLINYIRTTGFDTMVV